MGLGGILRCRCPGQISGRGLLVLADLLLLRAAAVDQPLCDGSTLPPLLFQHRYNVTLSLVEDGRISVATATPVGECPLLYEGAGAKALLA